MAEAAQPERTRDAERTRAELLAVATEVFAEQGLSGARVDEIAELTFDHHHAHPAFIRLVSIENIHRGEHLRQVASLRDLSRPVATLLDDALERGRASGEFRSDVDAIDLHMLISSYCVFQVANNATFGYLFGRDMSAPTVRDRHRRILGDVVVAWLTQT